MCMETRFAHKVFMYLNSTIPKFPMTMNISPDSQFFPQLKCILFSGLWGTSTIFKAGLDWNSTVLQINKSRSKYLNPFAKHQLSLASNQTSDGSKVPWVVPTNRTRGSNQNTGIPLEYKQNFLTVQVTEHWNRLPREVLEFLSSLEIFESHVDTILSNVHEMTSSGPFQT